MGGTMSSEFLEQVEQLAEADGRFHKEAYLFIYDALQHTVTKLGKTNLPREQRHISGRDLLCGISQYGLDQFGPLTRSVFSHWGVSATRDFGEIVFSLVEAKLMSKTDEDCLDDFTDVYDFDAEFDWKRRRAEFRRTSD
jgi:uncharacterized repeat protein (TIGR04138 family)